MGFIDPKREDDDGGGNLPGASGIHLDLDLKRCPSCRREVDPWRTECPDCGEVAVATSAVPASEFLLPGLVDDEFETPHDGDDDPSDDPSDDGGGAAP